MTSHVALVGMLWGLLFAAAGLFLGGARKGAEEALVPTAGLVLVAPYVGSAGFVLALPLAALARRLAAGRPSGLPLILAAFSIGPLLGLLAGPLVEAFLPSVARAFDFDARAGLAGAVGGIGLGWGCIRQALLERIREARP